eukprot:1479402-Pyramimonas_sp.AAC.1
MKSAPCSSSTAASTQRRARNRASEMPVRSRAESLGIAPPRPKFLGDARECPRERRAQLQK